MNNKQKTFIEICLYEVKPDKTGDFEDLLKKVVKHHKGFPGVIGVQYMKRTHRPVDFGGAKRGNPAIKLTRKPKAVTYALYYGQSKKSISSRSGYNSHCGKRW